MTFTSCLKMPGHTWTESVGFMPAQMPWTPLICWAESFWPDSVQCCPGILGQEKNAMSAINFNRINSDGTHAISQTNIPQIINRGTQGAMTKLVMCSSMHRNPSYPPLPAQKFEQNRDWSILIYGNGRYGYYKKLDFRSQIEKCKQFVAEVGFRKWTLVIFWVFVIWVPMLQMDRSEYWHIKSSLV